MADFTQNDKKISSGIRTAFHVYLDSGTTSKTQRVPFRCVLRNLSISFDTDCDWMIKAEVIIDGKVVARARGKSLKVEYSLEEPIFPNSDVVFEISIIGGTPTDYQVAMWGDVLA